MTQPDNLDNSGSFAPFPGTLVGLILGLVTQRYGRAAEPVDQPVG